LEEWRRLLPLNDGIEAQTVIGMAEAGARVLKESLDAGGF